MTLISSILSQYFRDVVAELLQYRQPLGGSFQDLRLRLKDSPPFPFREYAHYFAHTPARRPQDLQALHARDQQRHTAIAHQANALGIAFESLEFESRNVEALKLFGGIQHATNS